MNEDHVRRIKRLREYLADPEIGQLLLFKLTGARERGCYIRMTGIIGRILEAPDVAQETMEVLIAALQQTVGEADAIDLVDLGQTIRDVGDVIGDKTGWMRLHKAVGYNLGALLIGTDIDPVH